jgi:hypothetical protein
MPKSSQIQLAERINLAFDLLGKGSAKEEVVAVLIRRYQVSTRQAHRYIEQAQQTKRKLPIPEQKIVFTVKLPVSLVTRLRRLAGSTGKSLSYLVSQALEAFLSRGRHG